MDKSEARTTPRSRSDRDEIQCIAEMDCRTRTFAFRKVPIQQSECIVIAKISS